MAQSQQKLCEVNLCLYLLAGHFLFRRTKKINSSILFMIVTQFCIKDLELLLCSKYKQIQTQHLIFQTDLGLFLFSLTYKGMISRCHRNRSHSKFTAAAGVSNNDKNGKIVIIHNDPSLAKICFRVFWWQD